MAEKNRYPPAAEHLSDLASLQRRCRLPSKEIPVGLAVELTALLPKQLRSAQRRPVHGVTNDAVERLCSFNY